MHVKFYDHLKTKGFHRLGSLLIYFFTPNTAKKTDSFSSLLGYKYLLFLRLPPLTQTETPNKSRLENFKNPRSTNKQISHNNVTVLNKVWWKKTISITKLKFMASLPCLPRRRRKNQTPRLNLAVEEDVRPHPVERSSIKIDILNQTNIFHHRRSTYIIPNTKSFSIFTKEF